MKIPDKVTLKITKGKGRGVFANSNINKGEEIETAPIIILSFEELVDTKWNTLFDYYFWMDDFVALVLGYGSLYNHSDRPNAEYEIDKVNKFLTFKALRNIKKGEEICFNYRGKEKTKTPLWFEVKK